MNFNSVLKFFLPRDKVFFTYFEEVSDRLETMAFLLKDGVKQTEPEKRIGLLRQIKGLEHDNDDTTHKIFVELGQNFITPFDREDIHLLTSTLDDIADFICAASKRILMYKIYEVNDGISNLCEIILESVIELKGAVHELRNMDNLHNITEACVRINSLENRADDIYDEMVAHLFNNEKDTTLIIKLKEILESLEIATDKCEDAADVLETIIIKYT